MEKPFSFPAACDIIMYYCILEVLHMEKTRREIMDRVYLTHIACQKFKTSCLSAQFITPCAGKRRLYGAAAAGAQQRSERPDRAAVRRHADQLYGAQINPHHPQAGECQCIGLGLGMDDKAAPPWGNEAPGAHRRPLLGELLLDPRHPQRPVSGGICGQRARQPAGQHPLHPQRQAGLGRSAAFAGDVPL